MAATYKILGQQAPAATTEVDLYTVPGAKSAVVSSIVICNRGATYTAINVSVSASGGATANKDYIYHSLTVPANDTFIGAVALTLSATDVVRVYSISGEVSFSLFGTEIT